MKKKYFTEEERKAAKKAQKKKWNIEHKERKREQDRRLKNKNKEKSNEYNKQYYSTVEGKANELKNRYIRADKVSGRIGDELPEKYIDVEWIKEQIQKGCTYKNQCGTTDWRLIGLNRINISLPHTKDNCEPCCWECNKRIEYERKKKQVIQIDPKTGEVLASYPSINDAAKAVNSSHSNISVCCNGKRKTHKGYKWSYEPL